MATKNKGHQKNDENSDLPDLVANEKPVGGVSLANRTGWSWTWAKHKRYRAWNSCLKSPSILEP